MVSSFITCGYKRPAITMVAMVFVASSMHGVCMHRCVFACLLIYYTHTHTYINNIICCMYEYAMWSVAEQLIEGKESHIHDSRDHNVVDYNISTHHCTQL